MISGSQDPTLVSGISGSDTAAPRSRRGRSYTVAAIALFCSCAQDPRSLGDINSSTLDPSSEAEDPALVVGTPQTPIETQATETLSVDISVSRLGIVDPAQVIRDRDGIPHIIAASELDLVYLQGYVHARDRLFQMDVLRRQAAGTLAELLGPAVLPSDVQLRTFGIRRAGEASLPMLPPETRAALTAYAAGINAYVSTHPLPAEYAALEITQFVPWVPADSTSIGKLLSFQLAFDLNDLDQSNVLSAAINAGAENGFDGAALFYEDIARVSPFLPAAAIPDSLGTTLAATATRASARTASTVASSPLSDVVLRLARETMADVNAAPYAQDATKTPGDERGSNAFVVAGRHTRTGLPMIAGDPHLTLNTPSTFQEIHLVAPADGIDIIGASLPGVPYVIMGNTQYAAWTNTNNDLDVTDVFEERVVRDANSPSGLSTTYRGAREHIIPLPQQFRINTVGDGVPNSLAVVPAGGGVPAAVMIVPRRNRGPILRYDQTTGVALSVQYAGFSGSRDIEGFRRLSFVRTPADFNRAMEDLDIGSQNFLYSDINGNIGYFMSGEVPLREDLQAGTIVGMSPMFIRNGQGGNEWLPATSVDPTRTLPYEILPRAEMPHVLNPARGFIVTANNDPVGHMLDNDAFNQHRPNGGILYFGAFFSDGVRATRITELLAQKVANGRIDTEDLKAIQADTVMLDARVFTPWILQAFANARLPGAHPQLAQIAADPRIIEAVGRLTAWDQSTPTGIAQGYDSNDQRGRRDAPGATEIQHSVATTIFSVWRNQFLRTVVADSLDRVGVPVFNTGRRDLLTTARTVLDRFSSLQGIGASGLNFFDVPGISDAAARRDVTLLKCLGDALDLLAGETYADAYRYSTVQNDYRWGMLHRVLLAHPLGAPFNIPPGGGVFPSPLDPPLVGIPIDGGLLTVDVANTTLMQDSVDAFVVRAGPVRRYVAQARGMGLGYGSEVSFPGGASAVMGSPYATNVLESWLINKVIPLRQNLLELIVNMVTLELVLPL